MDFRYYSCGKMSSLVRWIKGRINDSNRAGLWMDLHGFAEAVMDCLRPLDILHSMNNE